MRYTVDLEDLSPMLKELARQQIPFATSVTLNRGMNAGIQAVKDYMDQGGIEGGPVPFTKQGMSTIATSKRDLSGLIYFKANRFYMQELIHGGVKKGNEGRVIAEPDVRKPPSIKILTSKGNYRRNYLQNAMKLAGKKGQPKKGMKNTKGYEVGLSKNKKIFGLWQWRGKGKTRKPELIAYLSRKNRTQRPTFERAPTVAFEALNEYYEKNFPINFSNAIADSIKRT
jgi:hypothetical protein